MSSLSSFLVLTACHGIGDQSEPYYGNGKAPEVSSLDVTSEPGNIGRGILQISGSGFGADPGAVTVQFGSLNATVLEATESSLTVKVPPGPIEGGPVDVVVGTAGGFTRLEDGYTYEVSDLTLDETAYVSIVNNWSSCYGGGDTDDVFSDCQTFAYTGITGLRGNAEFFDTPFPRLHSFNLGFVAGSDVSTGEWKVELPSDSFFPAGIDQLRESAGPVTLTNPHAVGQTFCVDTSLLGSYSYPAGTVSGVDPKTGAPQYYSGTSVSATIDLLSESATCKEPDAKAYDLGVLEFCEIPSFADSNHAYEAEWPINQPFFVGPVEGSEELSDEAPVDVVIDIPERGIEGVPLKLPEYVQIYGTRGFTDSIGLGEDRLAEYWWTSELNTCLDGDGDGSATLDEGGIRFEWRPSTVDAKQNVGGSVTGMETYVQISITMGRVLWLGWDSTPARATIRVDDFNEYDPETGFSGVDVPNWVLYQFPSLDGNWGYVESGDGGFGGQGADTMVWGENDGHYGYLIMDVNRISEFAISTEGQGDVIVAYATGEFSFNTTWRNPLDLGGCGDCVDNDSDGWVDDSDPDCDDSQVEDGSAQGSYTCHDGIDNDEDGTIDVDDVDCEDGYDSESNCDDEIDNDGDGFTDEDDGECTTPGLGQEIGNDLPWWGCSNGLDDDKDGWIDLEDPGCTSGADPEDDGFDSDYGCNNGLDDDGHGDIDASDPYCWKYGPDTLNEAPTYSAASDCGDEVDNDGDGYVDGNDPGCEFSPFSDEGDTFDDPVERPTTKECYDGLDNDNDGLTDALDPACWNGGIPDGNLDDELSDAF